MSFSTKAFIASALLAVVNAQGVIIKAQGPKGPASLPLLVDVNKADANIINTKEITDNVVNECGRTILAGNIDIGENTENQLLNKTVTQVTKGSTVDVTIKQVSADGAGPYSCDLDQTSNANGATGQTKLKVTEAQPQNGNINLKVQMPADMACVGASTGDVCTVRCFNTAAAGPFGGCFAVQQTDTKAKDNTPANIPTAQTLDGILTQVQQNVKDLPAAVKSNQEAATQDEQGVTAVKELLGNGATLKAAGPAVGGNANTGNANANTGNTGNTGNGKNRGKNNNNAGAATGNNNAAAGNANNAATGNTGAATGNTGAATGNNGAATGNGKNKGNNNNAAAGNNNAAAGNANNAATGNTGAATGNTGAATGNNNAAAGNANNAATGNTGAATGNTGAATGNGRGGRNNQNNNKRALRFARRNYYN